METTILVNDNHFVLRRIPFTNPSYIKPDGTVTSYAFRLRAEESGVSVDIEHLTTHQTSRRDNNRFRLLKLKVLDIRTNVDANLDVKHDPLPDNLAHALIVGNINKNVQRYLVKISELI